MAKESRYRLIRKIHSGGCSNVYLAHQTHLRREVVIKFFHCDNLESAKQLRQELASLCRLHHPNNVQIVDTGMASEEGEARPFVVLEHIPGRTLRKVLQQERRLSSLRTWRIAMQALAALQEAHEHGIVHRDVKPENLMLWEPAGLEEHLKIIDFGLATADHTSVSTRNTGAALGTPHYMAPEVAEGGRATPRSDLYSLAVVLFECLAGQRPFDGPEALAVLFQQVHKDPPRLRDLAPVPERFEAAIHKALQKDPQYRFESAAELLEELRKLSYSELRRYHMARFEPSVWEERIDTDTFEPGAFEAVAGIVGERSDMTSGMWSVAGVQKATGTALRSARTPSVWVLTEDPALNQPCMRLAMAQLAGRYDLRLLDAAERQAVVRDFMKGTEEAPWVLLFGDLHVILQDELLSTLRGTAETSRLLVSTHLNPDLLQSTVNFAGLDHHVSLPVEVEDVVQAVDRMVDRARAIRHHYDQLRLALRDAHSDLERFKRISDL